MNNYRPISIIPVVAKVFERIIYDQVFSYVIIIFITHKRLVKLPIVLAASSVCRQHQLDLCGY